MKKYIIQDREAGNIISTFLTMSDAQTALNEYENSDKKEGIYVPGFYELKEIEHPQPEEQVKEVDILDNKLVRWVEDGCPPIDPNKYPSLVIKLVSENKRLKEVNKLLVEALRYLLDDAETGWNKSFSSISKAKTALKEANLIK